MKINEFVQSMERLKMAMPSYAPNFDRETMVVWFDFFKNIDHDVFAHACRSAVLSGSAFPTIAKLLELCGQKYDDGSGDKTKATEIAERIWSAIGIYGGYRGEEAAAYLGEIGWAAVNLSGGWRSYCDIESEEMKTTYIAQVRDLIVSLLAKKRAGIPLNAVPVLNPQSQKVVDAVKLALTGID